jgi:hypothetical protein
MKAARQASAVAAAPVEIATITDRLKLHAALQQLIRGAYFGEHHEVVILSKAGLLLMVTARRGGAAPYLMMLRRDGQAAIVDSDGNLRNHRRIHRPARRWHDAAGCHDGR